MTAPITPSAFLTADELHTLTGRRRAKLQIAELRRMGIPHDVNALGRPVVWRDRSPHHAAATVPALGTVR